MTAKSSYQHAGSQFERAVLNLLGLFPGAKVSDETLLKGKKVDALLFLPGTLRPEFRVAIECKNYRNPLTRFQASQIVSDYLPIVDDRLVDQLLLITRNGLVPNAKELFDGRKTRHLTFTELANELFDPRPLVENMIRQFSSDGLSKVYIDQNVRAPDIEFAVANYNFLYSEFMDFAVELRLSNLQQARNAWKEAIGEDLKDLISLYSEAVFDKCYLARNDCSPVNLEQYALSWVNNDAAEFGLALLGSYGTGKSSFARKFAFECANRYKNDSLSRIPLLIELKEFGSHQDIRGLITHELINRHGLNNGSFELFNSLNEAGRFVIILDGFDEMKEGMTSDALLYNFHQINLLNVPKAKVLLCGRPTAFENDAEQRRILTGNLSVSNSVSRRYVRSEIHSFDLADVVNFLTNFAKTRARESSAAVASFVTSLKNADAQVLDRDLVSLLTRPVHLPMLVAVIPRGHLTLKNLHRASLYDSFVSTIIERELLKRRPGFQDLYPSSDRRNFARNIAVEMFRQGETRSIRLSEIPKNIFDYYVMPGRSLEAVRRDLVSACFLERKSPDILFFPHKSFLEFLVADFVVDYIRTNDHPESDKLNIKLSVEVLSFAAEMFKDSDWSKISTQGVKNQKLVVSWLNLLRREQRTLPVEIADIWAQETMSLSAKMREKIAELIEERSRGEKGGNLSASLSTILQECVTDHSDVTAVNAYRALLRGGIVMPDQILLRSVGHLRLVKWVKLGWIERPRALSRIDLYNVIKERVRYLTHDEAI